MNARGRRFRSQLKVEFLRTGYSHFVVTASLAVFRQCPESRTIRSLSSPGRISGK
ncbi:hypothetical protein DPMN_142537 [Dreissena polymorpha]|uniref:Uncharacterized protein n=1 Tax=Dreissena polymorpha TaxID=45954 RepID=A0A9D4GBH1_DREPO|nr:hypothetical protein DPMN_142537 [Dreissena polymorpha]